LAESKGVNYEELRISQRVQKKEGIQKWAGKDQMQEWEKKGLPGLAEEESNLSAKQPWGGTTQRRPTPNKGLGGGKK